MLSKMREELLAKMEFRLRASILDDVRLEKSQRETWSFLSSGGNSMPDQVILLLETLDQKSLTSKENTVIFLSWFEFILYRSLPSLCFLPRKVPLVLVLKLVWWC